MRIALIGPVPPELGGATPGGVATHQVHLAAGLARAGIEAPLLATNTCVSPRARQIESESRGFALYRMVRASWSNPRYLSMVGLRRAIMYAAQLTRQRHGPSRRDVLANTLCYRRFLACVRPDAVHVQHPLERCLYVRLVQQLEGWRIPLVVTAHSLFGEHPEQTIAELMAPNLRAADRVIAVSEHVAEQAVQLGVRPDRVRVIRSGVDIDRFANADRQRARRQLDLSEDVPVVLFVGNLEPRKQVDVLLRAVAGVRQHLADVVLLVVGSGESAGSLDQTAPLAQLSGDLHLRDTVRFMGRVDEQELLECYAAADVFALASSSEAQGIVALEAMAAGLPVVATAVGGLKGTIDDGQTGFLVPPGDVPTLARVLGDVLRDPAKRKLVGAAGKRAVQREFTWSRAVDATVAVYREVLGCR